MPVISRWLLTRPFKSNTTTLDSYAGVGSLYIVADPDVRHANLLVSIGWTSNHIPGPGIVRGGIRTSSSQEVRKSQVPYRPGEVEKCRCNTSSRPHSSVARTPRVSESTTPARGMFLVRILTAASGVVGKPIRGARCKPSVRPSAPESRTDGTPRHGTSRYMFWGMPIPAIPCIAACCCCCMARACAALTGPLVLRN